MCAREITDLRLTSKRRKRSQFALGHRQAVGDDKGLPANLSVTYVVCDARRPIVATASLVDRGCRVELGERAVSKGEVVAYL